ncbi:MAG: response regulator [Pseudomonadota bacterium]
MTKAKAKTNVLLVDDEALFVDVIEKRLKKRDISIATAASGQEALEKLSETDRFEVVILDVKMPVMDGIETLAKIKKRHPLVEVIMLTAHATIESAIDGMKLGAFDYLMKPCEIEELVEKVEKAAGRKRGQEEKILEARLQEISLRHG